MAPQQEPPPSQQGLGQILCTLSQLGLTARRTRTLWQPSSPNPGPEKLLAHGDGTKQGWVAQGLKATNIYHGRHALD